jgi:vacuolar protein sorting-associated protein 35
MRAFDEMKKLEMFFMEETRLDNCYMVDMYELVQHADNVLELF